MLGCHRPGLSGVQLASLGEGLHQGPLVSLAGKAAADVEATCLGHETKARGPPAPFPDQAQHCACWRRRNVCRAQLHRGKAGQGRLGLELRDDRLTTGTPRGQRSQIIPRRAIQSLCRPAPSPLTRVLLARLTAPQVRQAPPCPPAPAAPSSCLPPSHQKARVESLLGSSCGRAWCPPVLVKVTPREGHGLDRSVIAVI